MTGDVITEAVPVSQTLFSGYNLIIVVLLLVVIPLLNRFMQPKKPTLVNPKLIEEQQYQLPPRTTPAQKLDDSRMVAVLLLGMALLYSVAEFGENGFSLGLNIVIGLFLFVGLLAHGSLERYYRAVDGGINGITGIVILFPFYGGIMGLMTGASVDGISIGSQISEFFVNVASKDTFPVLAFLSAGLVNIFVPSGGGQFAVQGPVMIPAGVKLGVDPAVTAMAIAWGDAWTNMIQPFWALPLLGIAGLDARAIMGYCLIVLVASGVIITGGFFFLT